MQDALPRHNMTRPHNTSDRVRCSTLINFQQDDIDEYQLIAQHCLSISVRRPFKDKDAVSCEGQIMWWRSNQMIINEMIMPGSPPSFDQLLEVGIL